MGTAVAVEDPGSRAEAPQARAGIGALPWAWIGPVLVAVIAGVLAFHRLDAPNALVWDETYYAKDGWSLLHYGVEHNWNANRDGNPANARFLAGSPETGLAPGGEWAAHPPAGKWFIALGIAVFGSDPFGYRSAAVLAGVLSVLILARVGRRLTGSTALGCAAGLLMALDGTWLVSSRTAMLDIFLLFWILAGFACLLVDRDKTRARLTTPKEPGATGPHPGGGTTPHAPRPDPSAPLRSATGAGPFLRHGWRIGAAVCFGLACGTKWSGVYALGFFWLLALIWDRNARKEAGVERPWRAMLKLDALPSLLQVWAVAATVYVLTWWGWFISGTGAQKAIFGRSVDGFQRDWAAKHPSDLWPGFLDPVRSLWHHHAMTLDFHAGLRVPNPAQSWPWEWPYLGKPAVMYRAEPLRGQDGCDAARCFSQVAAIGTPTLWWTSIAALLAVTVFAFAFRDWRAFAVVGGYLAMWLPWFPAAFDDRTMYSTYSLLMLPFAVLALVLLFERLLAVLPGERVPVFIGGLAFLGIVAVNLFYLHPLLTAEPLSESAREARVWFSSWD
ncbi:dolichyl-phosphate-mannose--protein mannosyltransferase [Spirillospora sp. CA-294931]|uniref:dolichyl-phosphate-mannose--protein mannosyltransferase n=1 Tax=Spirillospora sp. CA-294931 TaxID=3240042 RepID=UPI003D8A4EE5